MASFPNDEDTEETFSNNITNSQTKPECVSSPKELSPISSGNSNTLKDKVVETNSVHTDITGPSAQPEPVASQTGTTSTNPTKSNGSHKDFSFKTNIFIPKANSLSDLNNSSSQMNAGPPNPDQTKPDVTLDKSNANLAKPDVIPPPDVILLSPENIPPPDRSIPPPDADICPSNIGPLPDVSINTPNVHVSKSPPPDVSINTPEVSSNILDNSLSKPDLCQSNVNATLSKPDIIQGESNSSQIVQIANTTSQPDVSQVTSKPDVSQVTSKPDVSQVTSKPDVSQVTCKPVPDVGQVRPELNPDVSQVRVKPKLDLSCFKPADSQTKTYAGESKSSRSDSAKSVEAQPTGAGTTAPKKQISKPKPLPMGNLTPRKTAQTNKTGSSRPPNLGGSKLRKTTPSEENQSKDISKVKSSISNFEEVIQRCTGKLNIPNVISEVPISETDIELCNVIGAGVSGTVHIVKHKPSGFTMAAKKMKWNPQVEEQKRILMDLEIMSIQKSPYIVIYYGSLVCDDSAWLYMELMDTCLDKLIRKYGPMPENIVGKVVVSTLRALDYLKSVHGIIHRDVKPSNILIKRNGEIKMCDFGISKQLVESRAETRGAGPTAYISPERLDIELKEYDVRADVWSLGISVIELLTGKLPYSHCVSDFEVMSKILKDPAPSLSEDLPVSQECRDFIGICLRKDFRIRPNFRDLLGTSEFVKIFETKEVDVAGWYLSLNEK